MEGLELICFKIIASVGEARNSLLNAYAGGRGVFQ